MANLNDGKIVGNAWAISDENRATPDVPHF